jgi:hypothetical protein
LVDLKTGAQYGFVANSFICVSLLFLNQIHILNLSITYLVVIFFSAVVSIYSANKVQKLFISPTLADKKCPFCDTETCMTTLKLYCKNCGAISERGKDK